jgi:hypothetical protein
MALMVFLLASLRSLRPHLHKPLVLHGVPEVVVRVRVVRLEPEGRPVAVDGLLQLAHLPVRVAEVVVRVGEVGLELDRVPAKEG